MKPTRLTELIGKMEPKSVAVFASAHELRRNQDSDFEFRQDSDFTTSHGSTSLIAISVG
jgi:hypothetical protein